MTRRKSMKSLLLLFYNFPKTPPRFISLTLAFGMTLPLQARSLLQVPQPVRPWKPELRCDRNHYCGHFY